LKFKQTFWNPVLETLEPEKIKQLQLKKFQNIVKWAYDHSAFHRRLYTNAGINPEGQCTLIENELVDQLRLKTNLRYHIEIC
jgi:phenylacetate-coenzyme A ligase PaaK-like adenylate-forming protein